MSARCSPTTSYGKLPGALRLSDIALQGSSRLPRPAIVVGYKTFTLDPSLQSAVVIADTTLQQGQGMHGSFGRDNTFNFMAAIGPDFKAQYRDPLPASNADIAPTLLHLLGWSSRQHARSADRARAGRGVAGQNGAWRGWRRCLALSTPAADGRRTALEYQRYQGRRYLDRAAIRVVLHEERTGCRSR